MMPLNHDPKGEVLPEFRRFAKSFIKNFEASKNRMRDLLGTKYRHESGIFREELIRQFLVSILPASLSVDSGYVHGFSSELTSKQMDIIIWDSSRFPAIFRSGQLVVVCPESVVAALEIKSKMDTTTVKNGIKNLRSLVEIDFRFRARKKNNGEDVAPPIFTSLVCFDGPSNRSSILKAIGGESSTLPACAQDAISVALKNIDPMHLQVECVSPIDRAFVDLVVSIEPEQRVSFYRGWGPPDDISGQGTFGPGFRRVPYYYEQANKITSPIEKLAYSVMAASNKYLGVPVSSILSAWGDFDPISCMRLGDASEIIEASNVAAIDVKSFV